MATFYIDPSDVPRECPGCHECSWPFLPGGSSCNGSGRLGNPDGARVEVFYGFKTMKGAIVPAAGYPDIHALSEQSTAQGWYAGWQGIVRAGGPYPTEAAALEAARKEQGK